MTFLYVLLEGSDDKRFFDGVLRAELEKSRDIKTIMYANASSKNLETLVRSLNRRCGEYIIFADSDRDSCFGRSKERLQKKIPGADDAKVAVVKTEIESWYLAGITREGARDLQIPHYENTDSIDKERFNKIMRSKFESRIDFMAEIMRIFDANTARNKNSSFGYVWNRFISGRTGAIDGDHA